MTFTTHLTCSPRGQTDHTHSLLEVRLSVEFEQRDVVVQRLAVVVVVDVGGGHPQCLGSGGTVLLGQVVVSHTNVDGVSGSHDAETGWLWLYDS